VGEARQSRQPFQRTRHGFCVGLGRACGSCMCVCPTGCGEPSRRQGGVWPCFKFCLTCHVQVKAILLVPPLFLGHELLGKIGHGGAVATRRDPCSLVCTAYRHAPLPHEATGCCCAHGSVPTLPSETSTPLPFRRRETLSAALWVLGVLKLCGLWKILHTQLRVSASRFARCPLRREASSKASHEKGR